MSESKARLIYLAVVALAVAYTLLQFFTREEDISFPQAAITTLAVWILAFAAASVFVVLSLRWGKSRRNGAGEPTRFLSWAAVAGVIFGSLVIGPQQDQPELMGFAISIAPSAVLASLMIAASVATARGHGVERRSRTGQP